jgi:hypothetical protein
MKNLFLLQDDITFLNFGSFGACPKEIFDDYIQWQYLLEKEPVQFITVDGYSYINRQDEEPDTNKSRFGTIPLFENPKGKKGQYMREDMALWSWCLIENGSYRGGYGRHPIYYQLRGL